MLRPPQHLGRICPLSFPRGPCGATKPALQQAGCVTLSSASPPGSLQARKQAASLDLTFTKRRDLFRAPGREAKTSKIPQVSARSGVISIACVGRVTATRFPPPDLCLRLRRSASRQRPQGLPTPARSLPSALARCAAIILQSGGLIFFRPLFLYHKDQKRTLKRSPREQFAAALKRRGWKTNRRWQDHLGKAASFFSPPVLAARCICS